MQTNAQTVESTERKPLRLLPGVVIVTVQWLLWLILPIVVPEALVFGIVSGLLGGLAVVVWWGFFSRAPGLERWGAIVLMVVAPAATSRVIDESIATAGQGMFFAMYATPVVSLAFVLWAVAGRHLPDPTRHWAMVAAILLVCVGWTLLRIDGVTGNFAADFAPRWAETHEDRLLDLADESMSSTLTPPAANREIEWPGFRGPNRDGVIHGVRIDTDWAVSPPEELWRRPIGPAWSSFAVQGDLLYTQEQRGDEEIVSCYNVITGVPVWRHSDTARFWDSHAGAGPRGTPTLHGEHLYTLGGTGILNALDAGDGSVVWSRNAASDTKTEIPGWGIASSPLVVADIVIVATVGRLAAYDRASGDLRWIGPDGGDGYSSPHLMTIDGARQILFMRKAGALSVTPADGAVLWEHTWDDGSRIVQPSQISDGDLLLSGGEGTGIRRMTVEDGPDGWTVEERWTSNRLKPNFSDFIVHEDYAYGFDGGILACISVEDGQRAWKGGRYGHGQLVLLADQNLLLVVSEKGELVLVTASPDRFAELARIQALEGKTWNHPVLVDDVLLVRNGQEMVAFRLALTL